MDKKIIIVGSGGSGKDTLKKMFQQIGFECGVVTTTRPKRSYEVDGEDYDFITVEHFIGIVNKNLFLWHEEFNTWQYGLSITEWDEKDVFVINVPALKKIYDLIKNESIIIFVDTPLDIRMDRLSKRNDSDTVLRRVVADQNDFHDFNLYDIRIANSDGNVINEAIYSKCITKM